MSLVVRSVRRNGAGSVTFAVIQTGLGQTRTITRTVTPTLHDGPASAARTRIVVSAGVTGVDVTKTKVVNHPKITTGVFSALTRTKVGVRLVSASRIGMDYAVSATSYSHTVTALYRTFSIASSPQPRSTSRGTSLTSAPATPIIHNTTLSAGRTRITVHRIPSRPNVTTGVFRLLTDGNIDISVVVRSRHYQLIGNRPAHSVTFAITRTSTHATGTLVRRTTASLNFKRIIIGRTVTGIDMINVNVVCTPNITTQVFGTLSRRNVGLRVVTASRVGVDYIISRTRNIGTLRTIRDTFNLTNARIIMMPT